MGAGEGAMGFRLARRFDYLGLEPDRGARSVAGERLARLGRGEVRSVTTAELVPKTPFDLICAFEVLEHLDDDVAELSRWRALLAPEGRVLVSVPAHRARFAAADRVVGHVRRYDREDLVRALRAGGFEPVWIEAWGAGLGHALEWARNRIARGAEARSAAAGTARSGRWLQPHGRLQGWMTALGAAPFRLLQHPLRGTGSGIGWVALARPARVDA